MHIVAQVRALYPQAMPVRDFRYGASSSAPGTPLVIKAWHPAWPLEKGETYPAEPTPAQLASTVPAKPLPTLTARQLRLWLIGAGLTLKAVETQIKAIPDATARAKAQVEWEYATEYRREHPLVAQLGAALGLDGAQIDAAFRAGALL